jgi:hypothetical protein
MILSLKRVLTGLVIGASAYVVIATSIAYSTLPGRCGPTASQCKHECTVYVGKKRLNGNHKPGGQGCDPCSTTEL